MDKLDSYGDNFRNVPICVPNETEKDAQAFKEIIAKRSDNVARYLQDGSPDTHGSSQTSFLSESNDSNLGGDYIWNRFQLSESGDGGHKRKMKKEKKGSKR